MAPLYIPYRKLIAINIFYSKNPFFHTLRHNRDLPTGLYLVMVYKRKYLEHRGKHPADFENDYRQDKYDLLIIIVRCILGVKLAIIRNNSK